MHNEQNPGKLSDPSRFPLFEQAILPHLHTAYNLARWLTGHDQDAEDVVQEACLRAFRAFDGFYGADGRAWLLTIVRNSAFTFIKKKRPACLSTSFDEDLHGELQPEASNPSAIMRLAEDAQHLQIAMENLPPDFREVLVLRHQEGLSYNEIARVVGIPLGTVMSRLARARARLRKYQATGDGQGGSIMSCKDSQQIIGAYADGELDEAGKLEFQRHLQSCPPCSKLHEEERALAEAIALRARRFAAAEALRVRAMAALRAETGGPARGSISATD